MKTNIFILLAIITITTASTWILDQKQQTQSAPNFDYRTIDGQKGTLFDHQSKRIIVHFWATWCAPCIIEFPQLMELAKKHPGNLQLLAISVDKNAQDIKTFLAQEKILPPQNVLVIHDPKQEISKKTYGVQKFPESFFIDIDFHIKKRIIGANQNWLSSKWDKLIQK